MNESEISLNPEKINYKHSIKLIYKFGLKYKNKFLKAFFLFLITNIIRILSPLIIKQIIDVSIKNKDLSYFFELMLIYFFLNFIFFILSYQSLVILIKNGQLLISELKNSVYKKILGIDIDYFSKNNPGKLAARIQSDTSSLYEVFTEMSISIFVDIFVFIAIFLIMAYNNFKITLILFPVVLFMFALTYFYIVKTQKYFIDVRRKIADLSAFLSENIGFINLIKIFGVKDVIEEKHNDVNYKKFEKVFFIEMIASIFFISITLLDPLSKTIIFGYGGIKVLNNEVTIGLLVMFILYIGQLFEPIFRFSEYLSIIQKSFASAQRINSILNEKNKIITGDKYIEEFNNEIVFDDVWMKYDSSNWILKGVSFKLKKGKNIAIVGRTGEGKTTLVNVLLRFYDYQKGSIKIDGIELKDISFNSLRRIIGMVWQDVYLFPGSVMDNLKMMDDDIDDEKVFYSIKTLGLGEYYRKININKTVKEKGANLSVGEKQIISITRAMVLNQNIIIFDEATSNIDPYTEKIITDSIKKLMKHKTIIIIAHRLSTIENSDNIVFLHNGEIVEFGTHNELMEKKNYYYNFYNYLLPAAGRGDNL